VRDAGGARDRKDHGGAAQQPGQRQLGRARIVLLGEGVQRSAGAASSPVAMGYQGMKAMLLAAESRTSSASR
jgi:hypothetical protein